MTSKTIKLAGSFAFGLLIAGILLCVLIHLRDSLAWLSAALGLAAGWAAGILFAPYQSEQDRFREYIKLFSAFITGYLISKVDRLFELWFDLAHGPLLLDSIIAHRNSGMHHKFSVGRSVYIRRQKVCQFWFGL